MFVGDGGEQETRWEKREPVSDYPPLLPLCQQDKGGSSDLDNMTKLR